MTGVVISRNSPHGGSLPAVWANDQYRRLGVKRSSRPKPAIARFADYLASPAFDLTTLEEYLQTLSSVPILNQGQLGDCVCNGLISEYMKCQLMAGMTAHLFSPAALYALINNGVDEGSDPRDAIKAVQDIGLVLASDVPPNTWILARDIPPAALKNASRFRMSPSSVYQLANLAELVTADWLGFGTTLTINVGDNFGPDSTGLVGFTPGPGNHQVSGGQGFRRVNGTPQFRFVNSWGVEWGQSGYAWITAQHVEQQDNPLMFAYRWALSDPQDPTNPA